MKTDRRDLKKKIRILMVEDNPSDAELIEFELRQGGLSFSSLCVTEEEPFKKALKEFKPHVILSDIALPTFSGIDALQIAKNTNPHVSFLIVSGSASPCDRRNVLKLGANEFIDKAELSKLATAIKKAITSIITVQPITICQSQEF